jgi:hypothetical protein
MRCVRCNSEKVLKGRIFNQADYVSPEAFFRPKELKPFAFFGINIRVKKNDFSVCAKCGLVWATIDPAELVKVVAKNGRKNLKELIGVKEG